MNVAGCRREVVNDNALRSWQLAAIRHHILRARTTANENAEKKHAHCPDRNAASLQCFERTISHKNSSSAKRPISGRMGQAAEIDLNRAQIHLFVIGLRQGYFA